MKSNSSLFIRSVFSVLFMVSLAQAQSPAPSLAQAQSFAPAFFTMGVVSNTLTINFSTEAGVSYTIQAANDLAHPAWSNLQTVVGTGAILTVPVSMSRQRQYFRLSRLPLTGLAGAAWADRISRATANAMQTGSQSGLDPTQIGPAGALYAYWNFNDLAVSNPVTAWTDRIHGLVLRPPGTAPINTALGVLFNSTPNPLSTGTLSFGSNFTLWIVFRPDAVDANNRTLFGSATGTGLVMNNGQLYGSWGGTAFPSAQLNYAYAENTNETFDLVDACGTVYTNGVLCPQGVGQPANNFPFSILGSTTGQHNLSGFVQYVGLWTNYQFTASDAAALDTWVNTNGVTNVNGGLLAWYQLDEGSGSTTADASGNGHTATFVGSPTWASGFISNALSFSGNGQALNAGNIMDNLPAFSTSFWIRGPNWWYGTTAQQTYGSSMLDKYSGGQGWGIFADAPWDMKGFVWDSSGNWYESPPIQLSGGYWAARWHHVVCNYFYHVPLVDIYLDGVLCTGGNGPAEHGGGAVQSIANTGPLYIGGNSRAQDTSCEMDEIRGYNRPLSAQEIAILYRWRGQTGTGGQGSDYVTWNNPAPINYGAALTSVQLNATANVPGSFAYNPTSGTVLSAGAYVLSVVFTPTDTAHYSTLTNTVSLNVLRAPLTVTAANASRPYGAANPTFTGTITGVTNGDNITAAYSCSATPSSPPGTYPIVPSLVDPNNRQVNYTVTLVNGTLTVTGTQSGFDPTHIGPAGSLYAYWNFNDLAVSNPVTAWTDRIHGTVLRPSGTPPINTALGVLFNSTPNPLTTGTLSIGSNFTLWIVFRPDAVDANNRTLFGSATGTGLVMNNGQLYGSWGGTAFPSAQLNSAYAENTNETFDLVDACGTLYTNGVLCPQGVGQPANNFPFSILGSTTGQHNLSGFVQYVGLWNNYQFTAGDAAALDTWVNTNGVTNINGGLLAWYRLDEGSGSTTADASGNGHTATFVGSPTWISGLLGKALSFSGNGQALNAGNIMDNLPAFSTSFWIRGTDWWYGSVAQQTYGASMLDKASPGDNGQGWGIFADAPWDMKGYVEDLNGNWYESPPIQLSEGYWGARWHHVVCNYFYHVPLVDIYLDGVLCTGGNGPAEHGGGAPQSIANTAPLYIGGDNSAADASCEMDEVRGYNRPLSAQEIAILYRWRGQP